MNAAAIAVYLDALSLDAALRQRFAEVLAALPDPVADDLLRDPAFHVLDYDGTPGRTAHIPLRLGVTGPARTVALKRSLAGRRPEFARYVIAHELAHAHLRNAGRFPGDDPEHAADALAELWGFPRPG